MSQTIDESKEDSFRAVVLANHQDDAKDEPLIAEWTVKRPLLPSLLLCTDYRLIL